MKKLTVILLASVLTVVPLSVSYAHKDDNKADMQEMSGKPIMNEQMMEKMQSHMEEMRAVLDAVKNESDTQKREAMLHEHANKMRDMMTMMEGNKSMEMKDGKPMKHKHGEMSTESKVNMMEKRMSMMEDMMGQMMGHTAEKTKPVHKHKKN